MSTINIITKQLQCLLKCQKMDNLSVKCVTPDSSSIQLKKYTHLKCSPQILSFLKEIWASSSVWAVKLTLKEYILILLFLTFWS